MLAKAPSVRAPAKSTTNGRACKEKSKRWKVSKKRLLNVPFRLLPVATETPALQTRRKLQTYAPPCLIQSDGTECACLRLMLFARLRCEQESSGVSKSQLLKAPKGAFRASVRLPKTRSILILKARSAGDRSRSHRRPRLLFILSEDLKLPLCR